MLGLGLWWVVFGLEFGADLDLDVDGRHGVD